NAYDEEDVAVLQTLGNLVATAFENAEALGRMRELYLASVRALAAAVDARDPYTRSHSARVAALARSIAEEMDLSTDQVRRVQLGALLHDIGKIGVPDAILNKPGPLTEDEWIIMRTHSILGASIVNAVEPLRGHPSRGHRGRARPRPPSRAVRRKCPDPRSSARDPAAARVGDQRGAGHRRAGGEAPSHRVRRDGLRERLPAHARLVRGSSRDTCRGRPVRLLRRPASPSWTGHQLVGRRTRRAAECARWSARPAILRTSRNPFGPLCPAATRR